MFNVLHMEEIEEIISLQYPVCRWCWCNRFLHGIRSTAEDGTEHGISKLQLGLVSTACLQRIQLYNMAIHAIFSHRRRADCLDPYLTSRQSSPQSIVRCVFLKEAAVYEGKTVELGQAAYFCQW